MIVWFDLFQYANTNSPVSADGSCEHFLFAAIDVFFESNMVSTAMLQRRFKIGYSRAARIVDMLEHLGVIGPFSGSNPRQLLVSREKAYLLVFSTCEAIQTRSDAMSLFRKEDYLLLKDIIVASYVAACRHYVNISIMQEELRLKDCSYAKNIMNQLEDFAVIGPADESGYNKALITQVEWQQIASKYVDKKLLYAKSKYSLSYIDGLPGHEFEHYCADLLVKRGFQKASVTPASGDQGVDILAEKDGIKYAIQCKCYASDLGNTPIQEVESGKTFYGCHVGAVMTNRYFTAGAKKLAEKTGTLLWDRDALHEMMNHVLKMENAH